MATDPKSAQLDSIQKVKHARRQSDNFDARNGYTDAMPPPGLLNHAVSSPLEPGPIRQYTVRPCQVQDTESIDNIMRKAWPDEPEWRNPQFWTKEFIKPSSQRFGFVIEQSRGASKQNEVMGFAMYKWEMPLHGACKSSDDWFFDDFKTDSFEWNDGFSGKTKKKEASSTPNGYDMYYNNQNLKENWNRLATNFIHITGVMLSCCLCAFSIKIHALCFYVDQMSPSIHIKEGRDWAVS